MKHIVFVLSISIMLACNYNLTQEEAQTKLKSRMNEYLNTDPKKDHSKIAFETKDVVFFKEKDVYVCEFTVHMKNQPGEKRIDTTGIMKAEISTDFKNVKRLY